MSSSSVTYSPSRLDIAMRPLAADQVDELEVDHLDLVRLPPSASQRSLHPRL